MRARFCSIGMSRPVGASSGFGASSCGVQARLAVSTVPGLKTASGSNHRACRILTRTRNIIPQPIADRMKKSGSREEYHNPCSRSGVTRNSEPSDEWCRLDSEIPTTTTPKPIRCRILTARSARNFSRNVGSISMAVTVKYSMTHQNTSNKNE